jgi:hypothetical protein
MEDILARREANFGALKRDPESPQEIVWALMDSTQFGDLFVLEAIRFYTAMIANHPTDNDNGELNKPSPKVWYETAIVVQPLLNKLYGIGTQDA